MSNKDKEFIVPKGYIIPKSPNKITSPYLIHQRSMLNEVPEYRLSSSPAWTPSTPRADAIMSVSTRVEQLIRSGVTVAMMRNARTSSMQLNENKKNNSKIVSSMPSYQRNTFQSSKLQKPKTRKVLLEIDQYLRRRCAYQCLGEDMIVSGKVYNKTESTVVISITQVYLLPGIETPSIRTPKLSSLSETRHEDGCYDPFYDIESLNMYGICHVAEMQTTSNSNEPSNNKTNTTTTDNDMLDKDPAAIINGFSIGDTVKALVISVDIHSERIYVSFNNERIQHISLINHKLGIDTSLSRSNSYHTPIKKKESPVQSPNNHHQNNNQNIQQQQQHKTPEKDDKIPSYSPRYSPRHPNTRSPYAPSSGFSPGGFPVSGYGYGSHVPSPYALKLREGFRSTITSSPSNSLVGLVGSKRGEKQHHNGMNNNESFCISLKTDPLFQNPQGIFSGLKLHRINQYGTMLPYREVLDSEDYTVLRREQNRIWANESCEKGKQMQQRKMYTHAMTCYSHALQIDPNYAPAFVGKGAVLVWTGKLEEAIEMFTIALSLDKNVAYAEKYLNQTKHKLASNKSNNNSSSSSSSNV